MWLRSPMQRCMTQGQWWSIRRTQAPHCLQWWHRSGFGALHLEHQRGAPVERLTVIKARLYDMSGCVSPGDCPTSLVSDDRYAAVKKHHRSIANRRSVITWSTIPLVLGPYSVEITPKQSSTVVPTSSTRRTTVGTAARIPSIVEVRASQPTWLNWTVCHGLTRTRNTGHKSI